MKWQMTVVYDRINRAYDNPNWWYFTSLLLSYALFILSCTAVICHFITHSFVMSQMSFLLRHADALSSFSSSFLLLLPFSILAASWSRGMGRGRLLILLCHLPTLSEVEGKKKRGWGEWGESISMTRQKMTFDSLFMFLFAYTFSQLLQSSLIIIMLQSSLIDSYKS